MKNEKRVKTSTRRNSLFRTSLLIIRSSFFIFHSSFLLTACTDQKQAEAAQFFLKGNIQLQKREYGPAIRYYSEAILKRPDFADAYNNRGLARFRNGDNDNALADFSNAIQTDTTLKAAYLNRADLLLVTGDATSALADLQQISSVYRDSVLYQTRLGDVLARLHRSADALVAYARARALDPRSVDALVNRAALYFGQNKYDLARQDLDAALKIAPNQPDALTNLGLVLARQGKPAEALPNLDRALVGNPTEPVYQNNKAYALLLLNRDAEALPLLQQSLRLDDKNAEAHRNLALYYQHQHQPAQAQAESILAQQIDRTAGLVK